MIWTSGGYQVQAGTLLLLAWLLRHGLWHLWWTRVFHLSLWLIFLLAAFKQFQCQSLKSSTPLSEIQKWMPFFIRMGHWQSQNWLSYVQSLAALAFDDCNRQRAELTCICLELLYGSPWISGFFSQTPVKVASGIEPVSSQRRWYIILYIYMYILRTCHWGS